MADKKDVTKAMAASLSVLMEHGLLESELVLPQRESRRSKPFTGNRNVR